MNTNGSVSLTITASNQKVLFCSDHWMLGTAETIMLGVKIEAEGVHQYLWDSQGNRTTAETYDLSKKVRGYVLSLYVRVCVCGFFWGWGCCVGRMWASICPVVSVAAAGDGLTP